MTINLSFKNQRDTTDNGFKMPSPHRCDAKVKSQDVHEKLVFIFWGGVQAKSDAKVKLKLSMRSFHCLGGGGLKHPSNFDF